MNTHGDIELERTYLAKYIPAEITSTMPDHVEDTYIPDDLSVHPVVRLRHRGLRYEITKKQPLDEADVSKQMEQTIPLSATEYEALRVASKRIITKDRYKVMIDDYLAEVDVFRGELEGLVVIDFEFTSEAKKAAFVAPDCCLADVTQESFIAAGLLSGKSIADIRTELDRFHYVDLQLPPRQ